MEFVVYILYSAQHQKIYIGYTSNLIRRFISHNQFGKDWTHSFRPWKVIFVQYCSDKKSALHLEKKLKQANNRDKIWTELRGSYSEKGYIELILNE